jgi:Response regulator containing a CheY-like receiver domain and an HTH DNA-binding domain
MSAYYEIKGLKVRVSDHEPNFSMDRFRGQNDIEFYTKDACNNTLCVISQIEGYCEKHDLDISLFSEIIADVEAGRFEAKEENSEEIAHATFGISRSEYLSQREAAINNASFENKPRREQVRILKEEGKSISVISQILGVSEKTAKNYI